MSKKRKVTHRGHQKTNSGKKNISVKDETYDRLLTYGKNESFDSIISNVLDTLEFRQKIVSGTVNTEIKMMSGKTLAKETMPYLLGDRAIT